MGAFLSFSSWEKVPREAGADEGEPSNVRPLCGSPHPSRRLVGGEPTSPTRGEGKRMSMKALLPVLLVVALPGAAVAQVREDDLRIATGRRAYVACINSKVPVARAMR